MSPTMPSQSTRALPYQRCEVAIVGGGICGSALALLLRQRLGGARLLLLEREPAFRPAGGEIVSGLAGLFFSRDLLLGGLLARDHVPSHGARFWFADSESCPLEEMSELGTRSVPELPTFHVDRARFAESLLDRAARAGVAVARPTRVESIEPHWPWSRLTVETEAGPRRVEARWVVDAGGSAAQLARTLELRSRLEHPPLELYEARWSSVREPDGGGRSPLPFWPASRSLAANHFCGRGWCARLTPLPESQGAVALSCDPELFQLSREVDPLQAYSRFVRSRAGLRELLRGARIDPESFRDEDRPCWYPKQLCGLGWFLVGDAAGSCDPLFGAPLQRGVATVLNAARIIGDDLRGALGGSELEACLAEHAPSGQRDCFRQLACRGQGDYELLGDARAMAAAFFLDSAFGGLELRRFTGPNPPPLVAATGPSIWVRTARAFLRERLVQLARRRHEPGLYGRHNRGWRRSARTGALPPALGSLGAGLASWLRLELEDFRERFTPVAEDSRVSPTAEIAALVAGYDRTDQALRRS